MESYSYVWKGRCMYVQYIYIIILINELKQLNKFDWCNMYVCLYYIMICYFVCRIKLYMVFLCFQFSIFFFCNVDICELVFVNVCILYYCCNM